MARVATLRWLGVQRPRCGSSTLHSVGRIVALYRVIRRFFRAEVAFGAEEEAQLFGDGAG